MNSEAVTYLLPLLLPAAVVAGLIVCIEGWNKCARTHIWAAGLSPLERTAEALRGLGWFARTLGAIGAMCLTVAPDEWVRAGYALTLIGCAALVVRARVQEHIPAKPNPGEPTEMSADEFTRTVALPLRDWPQIDEFHQSAPTPPQRSDAEINAMASLRASMAINGDKFRGQQP